jgi:CHAT domain-containing protein
MAAIPLASVVVLHSRGGLSVQQGSLDPNLFARLKPYRTVEPRLSSILTYRPLLKAMPLLHSTTTGATARGEEPRIADGVRADDEPTAVVYLLNGSTDRAVKDLSSIASTSHNAATFNDLAAALLVQSEEADDAGLTADALAAADAALAVNPKFEPALFNRALALDRLALVPQARKAWDRYLASDPASPWADEARKNTYALGVVSEVGEWKRGLASARRSATADNVVFGNLARDHPEQARLWAEGDGLYEWATAFIEGNRTASAKTLDQVRQISMTLRKTSGESLLADVVGAIDHASSPAEREKLARGHKVYGDGKDAHFHGHPAEAESRFREAEEIFASCGTPMVYMARYYIGSALHAQLRLRESAEILEALANEQLYRRGYHAVDATLGWERGGCLMERGSLSAAIEVFVRSRDLLRAIGETKVPAVLDAFLASSYDYAGDSTEAWHARRRAFQELSRSGDDYRLLLAIEAAAAAAMRHGEWNRARALLNLSTEAAEQQGEALVAAEAFTFRARLNAEQGATSAARLDLGAAQRWAKGLTDSSARARFDATLAFVEGLLRARDDPRAAIARFSDSLRFFERADRRVEVPRIYLERATLLDHAGDAQAARQDLDAGIAFVESERRKITDPSQRAMLLASSDGLFEKAIELALRAGERERAFDFVERQRARALTEMFELGSAASATEVEPMRLTAIRASLAPDAAVVEYTLAGNQLVAFVVRRDSFSTVATPCDPERLKKITASTQEAVKQYSGDPLPALTEAYSLLWQPIHEELAGAQNIAISADRCLSGLPFAALYNPGTHRFLVEDASLTMAPSATLTIAASLHAHLPSHPSVASISGDAFDMDRYPKLHPLAWAAREAKDVASVYGKARVLVSRESKPASVVDLIRSHDVAHFATHGIVKRPVADSALVLSPDGDRGGELRIADIVKLDLHGTGLVVLAACRSDGAVERSDGPENLALAFVAAGVPTAIASLTDLDDDVSAPLMLALHRRLAAGVDASTAVRGVARDELWDTDGRLRQPLTWSNITVVGGSIGLTTNRKGRS